MPWIAAVVLALCLPEDGLEASDVRPSPRSQVHRPSSLLLSEDERLLFVANARSGSLALIDPQRRTLVDELPLGRSLVALAGLPRGGLLVADHEAHELLLVRHRGRSVEVQERLPVSPYPISLSVGPAGEWAVVACLWSQRIERVDLSASPLRSTGTLDLPFAPRHQLLLPGGARLLVADAFGGRISVVDVASLRLERTLDLDGHNVGGLALSEDGRHFLVSYQSHNGAAVTSGDDIIWGSLMASLLRIVPIEALVAAAPWKTSRVVELGEFGHGSADPAGVAVAPGGEVVVALGGTGNVAVGEPSGPRLHRVAAGRRPTAVVTDRRGRAFVANTLGDSISVIEVPSRRRVGEIALGPPVAPGLADEGERLFYDASRSRHRWMSCHSCHSEGHSSGLLADTLGDGSYGAPKRVPSLLGVGRSAPWGWDGGLATLEGQIRKSVATTLRGAPLTAGEVLALKAFLQRLEPPRLPSTSPADAFKRGLAVFERAGCERCHTPPSYTSPRTADVGIHDELGRRRFNPPSLLGVRHRRSFFHDGRAGTLRQVFSLFGHPNGGLAVGELEDLLSFLESL